MSKTVQVQIENNSWYLAQYSVFHDFYFSVCVCRQGKSLNDSTLLLVVSATITPVQY